MIHFSLFLHVLGEEMFFIVSSSTLGEETFFIVSSCTWCKFGRISKQNLRIGLFLRITFHQLWRNGSNDNSYFVVMYMMSSLYRPTWKLIISCHGPKVNLLQFQTCFGNWVFKATQVPSANLVNYVHDWCAPIFQHVPAFQSNHYELKDWCLV
jgi:hypothetical protein